MLGLSLSGSCPEILAISLYKCQNIHLSILMYRFWFGPIVGLTVSHVWSSFASCIFIEFGRLTPGDAYTNRKGEVRRYQPNGEWSITSMESWPAWWLRLNGRVIASWLDSRPVRVRALRLLVGRRLQSWEIDRRSKSTRLTFSLGFELETKTDIHRLRDKPQWLVRTKVPSNDGTHAPWTAPGIRILIGHDSMQRL